MTETGSPLTAADLAALAQVTTPTIANAIEVFDVRSRSTGFLNPSVQAIVGGEVPLLGYACTARMRAGTPPQTRAGGLRRQLWEHILTVPAPRVVVIEDLDDPPVGAFWGEVQSAIHQALGCVGVVTNGGVRDLAELRALGFQRFAGAVMVSHAYVHLVEVGAPVTVGGLRIQPGDLLHGDQHGVVAIPLALAREIPQAAHEIEARERTIIDLCRSLAGVRPSVTICTKFGHSAEFPPTNFDVAALRPSLEASLRRLRTDYVDVLLLHNPPVELLDGTRAPHYEELERLKAEGKLRVYGVSLDHRQELERVLATTRSGALEVYFNVWHQELRAAFPRAREQGVGLIVKVPLDSGWLSGKYRGDSRFTGVRRRWSPDVITRRARLVEQVAALVPPGVSLAHAALRYVLAQPEVSTVIPGAKTVAQVRENAAAGDGQLPDDVVRALDALWERELRDHPLPW